MTHYAKIINGLVQRVIAADAAFFDTFVDKEPGEWVETFEGEDFAGIGGTYDRTTQRFIEKSPFPSWRLVQGSSRYSPPIPFPEDSRNYRWHEDSTSWVEVTGE